MQEMEYEKELLGKLVAIDTDSTEKKNYKKCANLLRREAKKIGLKVRVYNAKAKDGRPRPNLILEKNVGAKETMLILTHYDVVSAGTGWRTKPFKLTQKGSRLFGRGTFDDKGGIAAAFGAMRDIDSRECKRNVKIAIVCDEEVGGRYGAKFLVTKRRKAIKSNFVLVVDGDRDQVSIGCSGVTRGQITIKGRAGHAAYPHKTPNVIHKALPFLNELVKFKDVVEKKRSALNAPKSSAYKKIWGRFSITIVQAGYKTNVIPAQLVAGFDLRALPEENWRKAVHDFRVFAKRKMKKYGIKARIETLSSQGYVTDPESRYAKEVVKAARKVSGKRLRVVGQLGAEDGRWFAKKLRMPVIAFGPGGRNMHAENESISLKDLEITKETIKELVLG